MTDRQRLGTTDEVSEYAGIPKQTLYDQRHRGVGIGALGIKVGRHLRFRWSDIDAYLDEQARTGREAA